MVLNPVSGTHDPDATAGAVRRALEDHGYQVEIRPTREDGDAARWSSSAAEEGVDLLVAVGGDGTVASVLDGARHAPEPVPVAIVPMGSANGVARAMGIPSAGTEVLPALLQGRVVPIDLFEVASTGRAFVLFLGAGFDADLNADVPRASKRRFGFFAYLAAAARRLRPRPSHRIDLRLDGRSLRTRGHSVSLVNAAPVPFWGLPLGPEALSDDGLLDVTVLRRRGPVGVAWDALDLLTGRAHETRAWQARRVTVDATPALPVHADGELIGTTPVTVTAVPYGARL
ncbi:MAG: YegS/Rv2252/BmrU family lipid kinase, partial [Deinococcus-Thermus bacterium]|nr:YegS/Rv2252/BmrU family lipid kinase [Deinococcota bacterium]